MKNKSVFVKTDFTGEMLKSVYLEGDAMIEALEEIAHSENQSETVGKIIAALETNCGNCKSWLTCPQSAYFTDEEETRTCENWKARK